MEELSIREIQEVTLKLLLQYDAVCRRHGWRYSLCGGTLIGAVRHQGFIPWDDDVDVFMPRPDFDSFIAHCKQGGEPFRLITYDTVKEYNRFFAKLWDPSTLIEDEVTAPSYEIGVSIDVFPIDGLGDTREEALRIYRQTEWDRELLIPTGWKKYTRSTTHGLAMEPIRLAMFILSRFVEPKGLLRKVEDIHRGHPFDECQFAGDVFGSYRKREIMEQWAFRDLIELPFEGHPVMALKHYDDFLTNIYGDYMKLPPESQRVTHHTYKAYKRPERP